MNDKPSPPPQYWENAPLDANSIVEPLQGKIEIADYNPEWPSRFAREVRRIRAVLAWQALAIEHVGSTSVPGLPAKPTIDIVLTVSDAAYEDKYVPALESLGYRLIIREPEWFEHRMLKYLDPAINLHVFPEGCPEVARMRLFRDWLRTNDADRMLYARSKRLLAQRNWTSVQDYADAKTEIVRLIMERAERCTTRFL
jgi:GrpB-like predicted nucleotidyltransferase (UPF0157 family)